MLDSLGNWNLISKTLRLIMLPLLCDRHVQYCTCTNQHLYGKCDTFPIEVYVCYTHRNTVTLFNCLRAQHRGLLISELTLITIITALT